MRKITLPEVRQIQLSIMDDIHNYCVTNNIRYSLSGGSLLGGIRHKGFIPWDDDIDIMMPRPDYDKFLKSYSANGKYRIDDHSLNEDYICAFAKVYDPNTFTVGPNIIDDRYVFVDVFPIDGMPEKEDLDKYIDRIQYLVDRLRKRGKYYRYAKSYLKKIEFYCKYLIKTINMPSLNELFGSLNQELAKYDFNGASFAGVSIGQYGKREWMDRKIFEDFELLKFEDREYFGLKEYDVYLSNLYGDYLKLPPEDKRVPAHFVETYIND